MTSAALRLEASIYESAAFSWHHGRQSLTALGCHFSTSSRTQGVTTLSTMARCTLCICDCKTWSTATLGWKAQPGNRLGLSIVCSAPAGECQTPNGSPALEHSVVMHRCWRTSEAHTFELPWAAWHIYCRALSYPICTDLHRIESPAW